MQNATAGLHSVSVLVSQRGLRVCVSCDIRWSCCRMPPRREGPTASRQGSVGSDGEDGEEVRPHLRTRSTARREQAAGDQFMTYGGEHRVGTHGYPNTDPLQAAMPGIADPTGEAGAQAAVHGAQQAHLAAPAVWTAQQIPPPIPQPSQAAVSSGVAATGGSIDVSTLAQALSLAMPRPAPGKSQVEKHKFPVWNHKHDHFRIFKKEVESWAKMVGESSLLINDPLAQSSQAHEQVMHWLFTTLPKEDRDFVADCSFVHEVWSLLHAKYIPSVEVEIQKLYHQLSSAQQAGKPLEKHVNEVVGIVNQMRGLGETVSDQLYRARLLAVDKEYSLLQPMLQALPVQQIVSTLLTHAQTNSKPTPSRFPRDDRGGQQRYGGRGYRGGRHGGRQGGPPQVAAVGAGVAGGADKRKCFNCDKPGHLQQDCPLLSAEVKQYLQKRAAAGRGRGRGRGGPQVAVVDLKELRDDCADGPSPNMPYTFLVDSGSDINICFDYDMFCEIKPSDVPQCQPLDQGRLDMYGVGTIRATLGEYVNARDAVIPVDIELTNVYWVPSSPINILSTKELKKSNIYLHTSKTGNRVEMPGFFDQAYLTYKNCEQGVDEDEMPTLSWLCGQGRPIWQMRPVDSGADWTSANNLFHRNRKWVHEQRQVAAVTGVPDGQGSSFQVDPSFLVHLAFHHAGNRVLQLMRDNMDLYDLKVPKPTGVALECHGCHVAEQRSGERAQHGGRVTENATYAGEVLHADLAGQIKPVGIGGMNYILVVVDEYSRYSHVIPLKSKSGAAEMICLLIERIRTQIVYDKEIGVRRLHTDQGGEFSSNQLAQYLEWRGIDHTFTATCQHESNGMVERKIGVLNKSVRASLLQAGVPAFLWPEAYMCVNHAHNLSPSTALEGVRRKEAKHKLEEKHLACSYESWSTHETARATQLKSRRAKVQEMSLQALADAGIARGDTKFVAECVRNVDVRQIVPYLLWFRKVSEDTFRLVVAQVKPFGCPLYVYARREDFRHLDERGVLGTYMGPGAGPHMDRAYVKRGNGGAVRMYRHTAAPPALLREFAKRFHMSEQATVDPVVLDNYELGEFEIMADEHTRLVPDAGFLPNMKKWLKSTSVRAVRPPASREHMMPERGRNVDWSEGEHLALGHTHWEPGRQLSRRFVPDDELPEGEPPFSPHRLGSELIARHERWHTPEISEAVVTARCAYTAEDCVNKVPDWEYDAVVQPSGPYKAERRPRDVLPTRDRAVLDMGKARIDPMSSQEDVSESEAQRDAELEGDDPSGSESGSEGTESSASQSRSRSRSPQRVQRSRGREPSESPPPARDDSHGRYNRRHGSAVSGRVDRWEHDKPRHVPQRERQGHDELRHVPRGDQAGGADSGGELAPNAEEGSGERLAPPPEVRVQWVPKPFQLIRRNLRPAVHAVGVSEKDDVAVERISPEEAREHDAGSSTVVNIENDAGDLAEGVFATADSVTPDAEKTAGQEVIPSSGKTASRSESRRAAAARKKVEAMLDDPTVQQAMRGCHREQWIIAMLDELASLREHDVFELVWCPAGVKLVTGKWVLKIKRGAQGEIERFKARYVARGFTQVEGVDFFETWAPVGSYATFRALLSVCAVEDLETRHIDIKCAFLNGVLEEEVYVAQPPVLDDGSGMVWRLKKALYGLKQAAREWHKALAELLLSMGFVRSARDPALFICKVGRCLIFLWVDDLLIFGRKEQMDDAISKILEAFEGRDLGELGYVLGMEVIRDRSARTITISHRKNIRDMLERFSMSECRKAPTPLVPKQKVFSLKDDPSQEKATVAEHKRFMQAVGSIQYVAAVSRPDISFPANVLARHMAGSAKCHWAAVQHVLRYLRGTIDFGLTFSGSNEGSAVLEAYTDADFANGACLKSVSGVIVRMHGNCVFWRSKRQTIVAGDTTEAELIAMSSAANEVMWAKQLCTDLGLSAVKPTLWGDNKSANLLAVNPISSDRSKHIRVRDLRVREFVELDELTISWVSTVDMLADMFTKVLAGPALAKFRDRLQLAVVQA